MNTKVNESSKADGNSQTFPNGNLHDKDANKDNNRSQKLKEKYRYHHDHKPDFIKRIANSRKFSKLFRIFLFMITMINLVVSPALFFYDVKTFLQYSSYFMLFLYLMRIPHFYYLDYQTFLPDFCYWSMLLQAYYILVDDMTNQNLFITQFCFSVGWVITGNITFSDAFVPHEFTNYGTFHLHMFQPIMGWIIRWYYLKEVPEQESFFGFWWICLPYFLAWNATFATIYFFTKDYFRKNQIQTSVDFLVDKKIVRKGNLLHTILFFFGEENYPIMFFLFQLPVFTIHYLSAMLSYKFYWFGLIYISSCFLASLARGADFYFTKFSKAVEFLQKDNKQSSNNNHKTNESENGKKVFQESTDAKDENQQHKDHHKRDMNSHPHHRASK